jgi:hypothetical protein
LPFLDGSKKKHCTTYLHLTVRVHRLRTSTKKYKHKEKKIKQSARGPQINQQRPQIFLKFSVIEKRFIWSNIKLE